jgi:hypothetical protein
MDYLAPVAAAVAAWIFGAVWYMGLGKPYRRALGLDPEACKGKPMPVAPLAICFVAELVMAAAPSCVLARMSVVGSVGGAMVGAPIGVGVILPTVIVNHLFPGRSQTLMAIDGLHWVGVAVIEGAVLGAFS